MLEPCAPVQPNPPSSRVARLALHAAENPANSCKPYPQKATSEIAASILAPPPSGAPRPPADLPAAGSRLKADRAPAAECADCSKDYRPSHSPEQYRAIRAGTKTEWARRDPAAWGRGRSRRIPSDTGANRHEAPEFPSPIFHWQIARDRDGTARNRRRRGARQFSVAAPRREFPAPLRAGIACDSRGFLR